MTATLTELQDITAAAIIDARGTACPGPLLEAKKGMADGRHRRHDRDLVDRSGDQDRHRRLVGQGRARVPRLARRRGLRPRLRHPPQVDRPAGGAAGTPAPPGLTSGAADAMTAADQQPARAGSSSRGSSCSRRTPSRIRASTSPAAPTCTTRRACNVIPLPCTSGIRPSWILHAFDGGLRRRVRRHRRRGVRVPPRLREALEQDRPDRPDGAQGARAGPEPAPRRGDLLRLRGAVHQAHDDVLRGARRDGPGERRVTDDDRQPAPPATRPQPSTTTSSSSAPASAAWSPPSSSATWATGSCSSRRRPRSAGR